MGKLFVGQQVPIPANTLVSTVGSQNTSFIYKDVGVVLEVTPHINDTGDVQLKIHAESSTVMAGQTILGGVIIATRNFRTDMTAKDGQTLVLGVSGSRRSPTRCTKRRSWVTFPFSVGR